MNVPTAPFTEPRQSPVKNPSRPLRVYLAKVGLDGHDRGIKIVARGLRDAGFHVIYGGIWRSPDEIALAALDEDADWIGLSLLSGAHMTLIPRVIDAIRNSRNTRARFLVGGIIPEGDIEQLKRMGVDAVFGPGTAINQIAQHLHASSSSSDESFDDVHLIQQVELGSRTALATCLSAIDRGHHFDLPAIDPGVRFRIAVTGSPGVGKSSLIAELADAMLKSGRRVAVLACDPESPFTGGALLGDRVRFHSTERPDDLFIRSLSVPSGRQGIADHIDMMAAALKLNGFDFVLIESVGTGQGDVMARTVADRVVLVVQPQSGDAIQWQKAGQMEIADAIVIQKSDLPGAERLEAELRQTMQVHGCREIPIHRVSATTKTGIDQLSKQLIAILG